MKLTRKEVAKKLIDYLHHHLTLVDLVEWAESAMMDADFDERDFETLQEIVGRLGLADVKAFGLSWEDCEGFLLRLGYQVNVMVSETQAVG